MNIDEVVNLLQKELNEIEDKIKKLKTKETEVKNTIKTLRENLQITVQCDKCSGEGMYFHRSCAEDEGDFKVCPKCYGKKRIKVI